MIRLDTIDFALNTRHAEREREVELEELFDPRTRILVVKPPDRAVRQHAPLDRAIADHVGAAQVAQHL